MISFERVDFDQAKSITKLDPTWKKLKYVMLIGIWVLRIGRVGY